MVGVILFLSGKGKGGAAEATPPSSIPPTNVVRTSERLRLTLFLVLGDDLADALGPEELGSAFAVETHLERAGGVVHTPAEAPVRVDELTVGDVEAGHGGQLDAGFDDLAERGDDATEALDQRGQVGGFEDLEQFGDVFRRHRLAESPLARVLLEQPDTLLLACLALLLELPDELFVDLLVELFVGLLFGLFRHSGVGCREHSHDQCPFRVGMNVQQPRGRGTWVVA